MISVDATAFIILALVFALVLVLKNLFFEPLARAMEQRNTRIEKARNAWADAEATIERARSEVQAAVQAARNEGYGLLDAERKKAQLKAREDLDAGRDRAQQRIDEAKKKLADETARAVRELESEANTLAASIATRILGREVA